MYEVSVQNDIVRMFNTLDLAVKYLKYKVYTGVSMFHIEQIVESGNMFRSVYGLYGEIKKAS